MTDEIMSVNFQSSVPAASGLPAHILVAPYGEVKSASGSFVVDAEAMQRTIEAFTAHGADLPIDFEHQSLGGAFSAPSGLAPAAGWIKALRAVVPDERSPDTATRGADSNLAFGSGLINAGANAGDDLAPGLWADVDWTPVAMEQLATRQYRYLSPVALVRR